MTFVYGNQHSEPDPVQTSHTFEGYLLVQVLGGPGIWLGNSAAGMKNPRGIDSAPDVLLDAIYIQPGDGPQYIPWRGPAFLFHPGAATSTAYGTVFQMGCNRI